MSARFAVVGAGFGDEGKGRVVDWLCSRVTRPVVVRFSGGPQAAHHVVTEDVSHVFSHFGSGTLRGAKTIWTRYCPVDPMMLLSEYTELKNLGYTPRISINLKCPVITPFEIEWNAQHMWHGSCGMGINAVRRRESRHHSILLEDIWFPSVLRTKVSLLSDFYGLNPGLDFINSFYLACDWIPECPEITTHDSLRELRVHKNIIFEGSQGLMLDQRTGFFPHVTPSNTGVDNIWKERMGFDTWLVTRAYQTRHGQGPMSRNVPHKIKPNLYEQNIEDGAQGEFRTTLLDLDLLIYAIMKNPMIKRRDLVLVITCMDLVQEDLRLFVNDKIVECKDEGTFVNMIFDAVRADRLFLSRSAVGEIEEVM